MKPVVIVGGGVVGLCSAYYALQQGHRVTVIDRDDPEREGCSYGNAGMVVPSHCVPLAAPGMVALGLKWMWNPESPFYIKPRFSPELWSWGWKFFRAANQHHVERSAPVLRDLHLASRASFEELRSEMGDDFGLVQRGLLMLCRTEAALEEEARGARESARIGVPAEVLDPAQTARLDSGVRYAIAGAVHYPLDCHLSPGRFMRALRRRIEAMGGRFLWNAEVCGWSRSADRIVSARIPGEEIEGEEFVLCGGSWSARTAAALSLRLPLQPGKGYSLTLAQPRALPGLCSILVEARVAVTPMGSSLRFGGTMEIAGLDERINPARVRGIVRAVPRYFPDFQESDFEGIPVWQGLRPCSPDGLPYVGRPRHLRNLVVATGHAMMGLSLGPVTGKIVASLLSDEAPGFPLDLLRPDRYNTKAAA